MGAAECGAEARGAVGSALLVPRRGNLGFSVEGGGGTTRGKGSSVVGGAELKTKTVGPDATEGPVEPGRAGKFLKARNCL